MTCNNSVAPFSRTLLACKGKSDRRVVQDRDPMRNRAISVVCRHRGVGDDDMCCLLVLDSVPLHRSGYASLSRVCTFMKVRTIRGCLEGLALMV